MDQKTLVKRRWSYKVRITVYMYKHLESLPDTSSQILDRKPCQTLFLSLTEIRLNPKRING